MGASSRGRGSRQARARTRTATHTERSTARPAPAAALTAGQTAWLAAMPAALLGALAIGVLGPPLGEALLAPRTARFWEAFSFAVLPEPAEQGRFLIALLVPLLLVGLTVVGVRRTRARRASEAVELAVVAIQLAAAAFVVVCLLRQQEVFGPFAPPHELSPPVHGVFTLSTLLVAATAAVAAVGAIRGTRVRAACARWMRDTRARRLVAGAVAVAAIAIWLLHAFNTEHTIKLAFEEVLYNTYFTYDETFAVLDGRSPLVDFAAQYGSLWPYVFAAIMSVIGTSLGVWVALALTTTGLGMLAIYAVLRRAAHSALGGLLLFLPILATSFLILEGTRQNRYTFATYFGAFPMRYAGPSILAWLVARHLGDEWPRRAWPLFLAAGLVALNNADAGVAALGATLAAPLWGAAPTRARLGRLALEAVAGLAAAFALVSLLTLARAGELPHPSLLVRYARLFARTGFAQYPMPGLGLHVVIYLTYLAAIGVATVRALRAERERLLTGMLAWSGVFGLGAGAYFAGRSTPDDLPAMFLPWGLALALLLIPALGAIREATWRRPPIAAAACLFGFLAMACSLAQTPAPWEQLQRLQRTARPILAAPLGQPLVARTTHPGEPVAILNLLGHRIGANVGVENVAPYSNAESMPTAEQLDETLAQLREAGGSKVFLDLETTRRELREALAGEGFRRTARDGRTELWVDRGRG
jgi:hypothetical protein